MINMLTLINHRLNSEQIDEARLSLGIDKIIEPNENVTSLWANVDPKGRLPDMTCVLDYLRSHSEHNDYVLVQGDFGATYYIVDWCFKHDRIPIYSTTNRSYLEVIQPDGSIKTTHIFKHVNYRFYMGCNDE